MKTRKKNAPDGALTRGELLAPGHTDRSSTLKPTGQGKPSRRWYEYSSVKL